MPGENILVVEDEADIQELIAYNLRKEAYRVTAVGDGEQAVKAAEAVRPDLLVLDLMLPGLGGLEVCKRLKRNPDTEDIPIIMLTARSDEVDIVTGLELGADDYITKPFNLKVFLTRVKAVLRRSRRVPAAEDQALDYGNLQIHPGRHEVRVEGRPVPLTVTEFNILKFLARRPGWVFTRGQIVEAVRGEDYAVTDGAVRGVGYRFRETA
jgi:two-component system phosphate regulon response regulator PhoB